MNHVFSERIHRSDLRGQNPSPPAPLSGERGAGAPGPWPRRQPGSPPTQASLSAQEEGQSTLRGESYGAEGRSLEAGSAWGLGDWEGML